MAGTNLLPSQDNFADASYHLTNTTVVGAQPDPAGNALAFNLLETSATGAHSIGASIVSIPNVLYKTSIWIQGGLTRGWALFCLTDGGANSFCVEINLATGACTSFVNGTINDGAFTVDSPVGSGGSGDGIGSFTIGVSTIGGIASGWYRITIYGRAPATVFGFTLYAESASGVLAYAGNTSNGLVIYDAWVMFATTCLEMPNPVPVKASSFQLAKPQLQTPIGAGFIQTIDRGPNLWVAQYETPPLDPYKDQALQQFLDLLDGGKNTFLGFDPRKTKPHASLGQPYNSQPWVTSGNPYLIAVDSIGGHITIGNLNNGYVLTRGDMVAYLDANIWRLFRVITGATVAGNLAMVRVTPTPPSFITWAMPAVRLTRASAEMKLVGTPQKSDKVEDSGPSYKFTAAQFINRM